MFQLNITQALLFFLSLQELKDAPGCIHPLAGRVLPYIGPVLSNVSSLNFVYPTTIL